MELVWPAPEFLPGYVEALRRGWSPDNVRAEASAEHLARITENADLFLAEQVDREAKGAPIPLPDGSLVPRLPGFHRWMWDGAFCGVIGFRWQRGSTELPPHCLGHIGYAVVPWKRRLGYATRALALLLPEARDEGLTHVDLVAEADNLPSQKVIVANGGVLIEQFKKPAAYGSKASLRYRIRLA